MPSQISNFTHLVQLLSYFLPPPFLYFLHKQLRPHADKCNGKLCAFFACFVSVRILFFINTTYFQELEVKLQSELKCQNIVTCSHIKFTQAVVDTEVILHRSHSKARPEISHVKSITVCHLFFSLCSLKEIMFKVSLALNFRSIK